MAKAVYTGKAMLSIYRTGGTQEHIPHDMPPTARKNKTGSFTLGFKPSRITLLSRKTKSRNEAIA